MLGLDAFDLDEIATALADQTDFEHRWLIGPKTGEVVFWTSETGIDGENPVDLDELELVVIDPLPSYVWYQDMVDFADGISDPVAGQAPGPGTAGQGSLPAFPERAVRAPPRPDLGLAGHA